MTAADSEQPRKRRRRRSPLLAALIVAGSEAAERARSIGRALLDELDHNAGLLASLAMTICTAGIALGLFAVGTANQAADAVRAAGQETPPTTRFTPAPTGTTVTTAPSTTAATSRQDTPATTAEFSADGQDDLGDLQRRLVDLEAVVDRVPHTHDEDDDAAIIADLDTLRADLAALAVKVDAIAASVATGPTCGPSMSFIPSFPLTTTSTLGPGRPPVTTGRGDGHTTDQEREP